MELTKKTGGTVLAGDSKDVKFKILDSIIFVCIALIFFLVPLFFTGIVNQGSGFEKALLFYFLTLIGVVAWATKGVTAGELKLKRTPLDLPILAVLIVFALSAAFSVSLKDSLIGFYGSPVKSMGSVLVLILFYYLAVNNLNTERIKALFWTVFASGSLLMIYSIFQIFGIYILPTEVAKTVGFNPLGTLTGLTIYLVSILPFLIIAATQIPQIHPKLKNKMLMIGLKSLAGAMIILDLVILFLLNGYTYWPIAVVTSVIVLMFMLARIVDYKQYDLIIPVGVFLVLMIFLVLGNFSPVNLNLPSEVSLSRGLTYSIAVNGIKKSPILGSGLGTYYYDFAKYKTDAFNYSPLWNVRFDSATGGLFELLNTTGVLGALAFIVLVLILLSLSFIAVIKTKDKLAQPIQLALVASFVASILFGLMFAFNNALLLNSFLLMILCAVVTINIYPEKFASLDLSFRSSPKYALALAAIFLTVTAGVAFLFTMGIKIYLADFYSRQSAILADQNAKIDAMNKSMSLASFQDNYFLSAANYYMSLANQEATSGGDQAKIQNYLNNAVQLGKQGLDLNPNFVGNNEALGLIYENASFYTRGALEWAETYYNKVSELEPINPVPAFRIALINMARANQQEDENEKSYYVNEAIKKYDEAIAKKNDLAAAYYGKGIAYEQLQKTDDAIEQLKSAAVYSGNNIDYEFELGRLYFNKGVTQPNLFQSATKEIAEDTIKDGQQPPADLSVQPDGATGGTQKLNDELSMAEQIFLSILQANPNHANSLYSLALLYQKTNQLDNSMLLVKKLLEVVPDDETKEAVKKQFEGLY